MARVAVRAVVHVIAEVLVLVIHRRLVVLVTREARKHLEVRSIRVAVRAGGPFSGVLAGIDGELRVAEGRAEPRRSRVARVAGSREIRGRVIWIGGLLKIQTMARKARIDTPGAL